jgi:hypothetical protein
MSETRVPQGRGLDSLRQVCDEYRIRQRARARLGGGITPIAVEVMISKIGDKQETAEGFSEKR